MRSVYVFSRQFNALDYHPTYPNNPKTLAEHIRKYRKDKGLTMAEFAEQMGTYKFAVLNWEVRGGVPRLKYLKKLGKAIPDLAAVAKDSYQKIAG